MTNVAEFSFTPTPAGVLWLQWMLSATVILMMAGGLALALRRQSAALRHRIWTLSMIAVLIVPPLTLVLPGLGPRWLPDPEQSDASPPAASARPDSRAGLHQPVRVSDDHLSNDERAQWGPSASARRDTSTAESRRSAAARQSLLSDPVAAQADAAVSRSANVQSSGEGPSASNDASSFIRPTNFWKALCAAWLAGGALGIGLLVRSWWSLATLLRRAVPVSDPRVGELNQRVRTLAMVERDVPLLCSVETAIPFTAGCRSPVIVLPAGYGQWGKERLQVVLKHELAHIRRHDVLWQWVARLTCVLYWGHPLLWVAKRQMRVERELACDDAVLTMGEPPDAYAGHLFDVAAAIQERSRRLDAAVAMAHRSQVEQRICSILQDSLNRSPVTRRTGRLLMTATLAVVIALSLLSPSTNRDSANGAQADDQPVAARGGNDNTSAAGEQSANENSDPQSAADPPPTVSDDGFVTTQGSMRIHVLDPSGQPFSGVSVEAKRKQYVTDARGIAVIRFPKRVHLLRVWVSKRGHVPLFLQWWPEEQPDGHLIPDEYTVQMEKGTVIGGVVKNKDGEPISGATVEVESESSLKQELSQRPVPSGWLAHGDEEPHPALKTDAQGRWTLDNVPAGDDVDVRIRLSHPDYIDDLRWGESQRDQLVTMEALRRQSAEIVMQRGVGVTGTVTDPDGNPVSNAVIIWGDGHFSFLRGSRTLLTDENGVYGLPRLQAGPMNVTVVAEGWAPDLKTVEIEPGMVPVDFNLKPGRKLRVRFVDEAGNPVPKTNVWLDRWRGAESLYNNKPSHALETKIPRLADEQGVYEWNWAPSDTVKYLFRKQGYAAAEVQLTADGSEHIQIMHPLLRIGGTARDVETGKPVEDYQVVPVHYFRPDFLSVNRPDAVDAEEGEFAIEFRRGDIEHGIRIEAMGYRTYTAGPWKIGDPAVTLDVALEPAAPVQGTVVDPQGQPVVGAGVYLATYTQQLELHNLVDDMDDNFVVESDREGRFAFPAQCEPYAIIAIHDFGYAERRCDVDEQPGQFNLQRWARVEGRVFQDGRAVAGQEVTIRPQWPRLPPLPWVSEHFWATTDSDGAFVFERVPPVNVCVGARLTVWRESKLRSSQFVPLDLRPAETKSIDLNGSGATVTGRVVVDGPVPSQIDLNYSLNYLLALRDGVEPPAALAETGFDWRDGWSRAFTDSIEGRAYLESLHHHFVKLGRDGSFRISGVPAGDYELAFKLYEPPEGGCLIQPIATHRLRFEVTDAHLQSGVDLGNVAVKAVLGPQSGETVPDFVLKSPGRPADRLSDLRGSYVLVDAWATWCTACVAARPEVQSIHDEFNDKGLVVLGLNLDQDREAALDFIEDKRVPWLQAYLGNWSESDVPTQLGISSIPAYVLIDPDGRLVRKSYRADEILALIRETLAHESP